MATEQPQESKWFWVRASGQDYKDHEINASKCIKTHYAECMKQISAQNPAIKSIHNLPHGKVVALALLGRGRSYPAALQEFTDRHDIFGPVVHPVIKILPLNDLSFQSSECIVKRQLTADNKNYQRVQESIDKLFTQKYPEYQHLNVVDDAAMLNVRQPWAEAMILGLVFNGTNMLY